MRRVVRYDRTATMDLIKMEAFRQHMAQVARPSAYMEPTSHLHLVNEHVRKGLAQGYRLYCAEYHSLFFPPRFP
jgi:hypothetical protein